MPSGRAESEDHLVLVSFDLPADLYVLACRAASQRGFASLEAYALHLLRELGGEETVQTRRAGEPLRGAACSRVDD